VGKDFQTEGVGLKGLERKYFELLDKAMPLISMKNVNLALTALLLCGS
jgi:hypothetical protein